jgi:hypothetical protein
MPDALLHLMQAPAAVDVSSGVLLCWRALM